MIWHNGNALLLSIKHLISSLTWRGNWGWCFRGFYVIVRAWGLEAMEGSQLKAVVQQVIVHIITNTHKAIGRSIYLEYTYYYLQTIPTDLLISNGITNWQKLQYAVWCTSIIWNISPSQFENVELYFVKTALLNMSTLHIWNHYKTNFFTQTNFIIHVYTHYAKRIQTSATRQCMCSSWASMSSARK